MTKSIFREVTIPYGGQAYPFTPSNRVLRRIEEEVSLTPPDQGAALRQTGDFANCLCGGRVFTGSGR